MGSMTMTMTELTCIFMFSQIFKSFCAKIIATFKHLYSLELANNMQENGTNYNFLAQRIKE